MNASPQFPPSRLRLLGLLVLSAVVLCFAMGRNTVSIAAWLAPIFLLRYTRLARGWIDWVLVWIVFFGAWLFQFRGMVPLPFGATLGVGLGASFCGLIPYFLERKLASRMSGFMSTLVFPCAVTALDFSTVLSPFGSWMVLGYSQYGNLPLMQLSSITGVYGLSFLVSWLGSTVNWAWKEGFDWRVIRTGTIIFSSLLTAVYGFGAARLFFCAPTGPYFRMAGVAAGGFRVFPNRDVEQRFWSGHDLEETELTALKDSLGKRIDALLAKSEREAKAGAHLIVWSETVAWVLRADEPSVIAKGAEFAIRNHVYLGMAICSIDPKQKKFARNKLLLIDPNGRLLFDYWKSRPVPGGELTVTETNGNPMYYADTPAGRTSGFICFDLDFPSLIRQAGRAHSDLVLAPSNDWPAIDPWNTRMAVFRAVENGFNLLRNVSNGRSIAVDYLGQVTAETDFFTSPDHVIVAYLPGHGVSTVYSLIGDLFAWLCIVTLFLLFLAFRAKRG